ncbi:protein FAM227B-like isoform X2 [Acanthaster planci]|uniref:Protein FAM227B-like isoform X2 n=1 Tax=Acanthaster planci TaxID=133434 RepID=A0A8B7Z7T3_ACAPL|nr:protein FAM227B-like isoform X2 [Acanthaster planci]
MYAMMSQDRSTSPGSMATGSITSSQIDRTKPAESLDEWLEKQNMKWEDWPVIQGDDCDFDVSSEKLLLGEKEDILNALHDHAPLPMYMLDNLESKLDQLQEHLDVYANQIVTSEALSYRWQNNLFHSPSAVMERALESNAVKASQRQKKDKTKEMRALILGSKARSVETSSFPGFSRKELTELPHGLEAPQILDRITKAQDFNSGFNKFWKKLFLSEASVAVMQDAFWWFFLQEYEPKREAEQNKLFNRIADSFVALFTSVNPDIKDKFFAVYSDCLAQSMFAAYWEAFIDSHHNFDAKFKQKVATLCSEWVAGIKPGPDAWSHWDIKRLQPKSMNKEKEEDKKKVVLMKEGKINKEADFSISVDVPSDEETWSEGAPNVGLSREVTLMTNKSLRFQPMTGMTGAQSGLMNTTRMALPPVPPMQAESHQMGPGPDFERVLFNIQGRSPLIAHYLYMKDLAGNEHIGRNVRRTEIAKMPPPALTYREVIKDTQRMKKSLNAEYQKIKEELAREMAAIEKQKREQTREIEQLKQKILLRNVDVKILSEKILDMRGKDGILALLKEAAGYEERQVLPANKRTGSGYNSSSDEDFDDE